MTRRTLMVFAAGAVALAARAGLAADLGPVRMLTGGPFEASGAVQAPAGDGVLFVDDSRPDVVLWLRLAADGSAGGAPVAIPLGMSVVDPEGITTDGTFVYVVGSQSRGKQKGGPGLVRFRIDAAHKKAESVESVADLTSILSGHVPALKASSGKGSALNIEGLAWDAKGRRLLLGLRAPLDGKNALLVPVALREAGGPFAASNLQVGEPIPLDLGGSGVRGIEADPDGGFWVLAGGVSNAGTARLVRWDGSGPAVRDIATFPTDLKPEGVTRAKVGDKVMTLVLCDTSRYLLMD